MPINLSNSGMNSINLILVQEIKTMSTVLLAMIFFTPEIMLCLSIEATTGSLISLDEPKGINDDYHPYNTFGWTDAGWNAARVSRNVIDRISPILDTNSRYLPSEDLIINTSLQ